MYNNQSQNENLNPNIPHPFQPQYFPYVITNQVKINNFEKYIFTYFKINNFEK